MNLLKELEPPVTRMAPCELSFDCSISSQVGMSIRALTGIQDFIAG
jgi:hypothetical protein